MRALPIRSVILDGEGVICGPDGVSDFDRMRALFSPHSPRAAFLCAFVEGAHAGVRLSEHIADVEFTCTHS